MSATAGPPRPDAAQRRRRRRRHARRILGRTALPRRRASPRASTRRSRCTTIPPVPRSTTPFHPMSVELWSYERARRSRGRSRRSPRARRAARASNVGSRTAARGASSEPARAEPQAGGTLTVDASVIDERRVASGQLRCAGVAVAPSDEGVATLDAPVTRRSRLPVGDGGTYVVAWYDVNRNERKSTSTSRQHTATIWATPRPACGPTRHRRRRSRRCSRRSSCRRPRRLPNPSSVTPHPLSVRRAARHGRPSSASSSRSPSIARTRSRAALSKTFSAATLTARHRRCSV